jgi:Zn-dependent membrane protease YugP
LPKGHELARQILDEHGLTRVKVERTDVGDHYDPEAKAVRLARDKYDRNTLAAVTTAAHEAAHAIQDATEYAPFIWRTRLVSLARVTGQVGSVALVAVAATGLIGRRSFPPIPPIVVGISLFAMLATGVAAQLAALPTELDASFRRALPLLRSRYVDDEQARDVHEILLAASSTYVAASLLAVLNIWPWLGVPRVGVPLQETTRRKGDAVSAIPAVPRLHNVGARGSNCPHPQDVIVPTRRTASPSGLLVKTVRVLSKPLVRLWFQIALASQQSVR